MIAVLTQQTTHLSLALVAIVQELIGFKQILIITETFILADLMIL